MRPRLRSWRISLVCKEMPILCWFPDKYFVHKRQSLVNFLSHISFLCWFFGKRDARGVGAPREEERCFTTFCPSSANAWVEIDGAEGKDISARVSFVTYRHGE